MTIYVYYIPALDELEVRKYSGNMISYLHNDFDYWINGYLIGVL